jgi:uncharacterized repeat protein (TIGR03847 family)
MDDTAFDFDFDPAAFITVGAVGPPGQRTFFLQATQGRQVVSLVIEKEQAIALAASIDRLLAGVEAHDLGDAESVDVTATGLDLLQPVNAEFRVVEMGLGVDEERGVIVLVSLEAPDDEPGKRARFTGTYAQMRVLARRAIAVAEQGRPFCPLCGRPIDPDGHFCPRTNGHGNPAT